MTGLGENIFPETMFFFIFLKCKEHPGFNRMAGGVAQDRQEGRAII